MKFTEAEPQPFTPPPAGTLMQMGSWNTRLGEEACTTRGHPPEDKSFSLGVAGIRR